VLGVLDSDQQATLHALLKQVTANAVVCSEQGALPVEVRP
jgi:hypothetical protein